MFVLWCLLADISAHASEVNLFNFNGNAPANGGGGQTLIDFAAGTPAGSFATQSLNFGANWFPNGLTSDFGADIFANISVAAAGSYTFSTTSDDGSLLFVDGQLVVNNNNYQGPTQRTGSVFLSAGTHLLEVQYFQGLGGDYLSVPLPSGVTYVDPSMEAPLNIYSSLSPVTSTYPAVLPGDTFIGTIPTVNLDYGTLYGGANWFPFGEQDNFVAEMQGFFYVASSGFYTFSTTSDDGSWLFIDGSMVVNNGFFQGFSQRTGTVFLNAGYYPFDLQYFQGGGGAGLDLGLPAGVSIEASPEPGTWGVVALTLALGAGAMYKHRKLC
jgi:hypothetical protein